MMKKLIFLFLLIITSQLHANGSSSSSSGQQNFNVTLNHSTPVIWNPDGSQVYNVFDTSTTYYEQTIDSTSDNFGVTHNNNQNSWFFIDFSKGKSNDYNRYLGNGNNKLYYQLYANPNKTCILMKANHASESNILQFRILSSNSPGTYDTLSYYWTINANQIVPPGTYTDTVTLKLYRKKITRSYKQKDSTRVTYRVTVPQMLQTKITGSYDSYESSNRTYNLDFGEAETGDSKDMNLQVRSNAGYRIKVKSDNQGYLHLQNGFVDNADHKIEYTFTFNQATVNLQQSTYQTVATSSKMTSNDGDSFPVTITIGDISEKFAGTYNDIIEIVAQVLD